MIDILIDNIFVQFGVCPFRHLIGIPMGRNCVPLFADLFFYSNENEFLDNIIKNGSRRRARSFNLCYGYTDDLKLNNLKLFVIFVSTKTNMKVLVLHIKI